MRTRPTTITLALLLASCAPPPDDALAPEEREEIAQALNNLPTSEVTSLPPNPCPTTGSDAIDTLNRIRKASSPDFWCVGHWQGLENAASSHAWYFSKNHGNAACEPATETEVSGCSGFSGATLRDRWTAQGVESVFKPVTEVPYSYSISPCGAPLGGSPTEMFASWLNHPLYRMRLLHGKVLKAGYARNSVSSGIFPACSTQYSHMLDIADTELGQTNPGHNGPIAVWPPPGASGVLTYQEPSIFPGNSDPNGGGIGYAMTMVNEVETQLIWRIRLMRNPTGSDFDREWSTSSSACGQDGCVQVMSHTSHPGQVHPTEVSFWTVDPLTPNRRYSAQVFVCHNVTGGCRWHEWGFWTGQ